MTKKTIKQVIAAGMVLLSITMPCISVSANYIDNAPVIYVEDDSQLPPAMRKNMENWDEVEQRLKQKEINFQKFLNQEYHNRLISRYNQGLMPYAMVYPSVHDIIQHPQETDYYCGYSALQSILEYYNIDMTQEEIAEEAYDVDSALAWFAGSQSQATNTRYYPAATYLNSKVDHTYSPYNSYFGTFTEDELSEKLKSDIAIDEVPVLICGISKKGEDAPSHLPGYTTDYDISHWIVAYGITWNIDQQKVTEVRYADPAKSEKVSWSASIKAYDKVDLGKMYSFSSGHGIIW